MKAPGITCAACARLWGLHTRCPWNLLFHAFAWRYAKRPKFRSEFFSDTLQSVHLTMSDVQVLQQKSSCSLALGFLAEIYIEQSRLSEAQKDQGRAAAAAALGTQCFSLLETTDPIRQSFWRQRRMDLMSNSSA